MGDFLFSGSSGMVINSTVSTMSRYRFIAVFVLASVLVGVISAAIWMVGTEMASAAKAQAQCRQNRSAEIAANNNGGWISMDDLITTKAQLPIECARRDDTIVCRQIPPKVEPK